MKWYCLCGKQLSNTIDHNTNEFVVFSAKEYENDAEAPSIYAYTCPDCGRISAFKVGEDGSFETKFLSYVPEHTRALAKAFEDEAWDVFADLCEKSDDHSVRVISDIRNLIRGIESGDIWVGTPDKDGIYEKAVMDYSIKYKLESDVILVTAIEKSR